MIRFSWKKIMSASKGDTSSIIWALTSFLGHKPRNKRDPLYRYQGISLSGDSFLVNLEDLLKDTKVNRYHICQYVYLASFRHLGDYITKGITHLDIRLSPLRVEQIIDNPLLIVKDKHIHFKYEDTLNG